MPTRLRPGRTFLADKKKRKRIRGGREGALGSTAQPNQGGGQAQGGNRNDRAPREGDARMAVWQ